MDTSDIHILPLTASVDTFEDDALKILKCIRPEWNSDKVSFKRYTDGIFNRLLGCHLEGYPDDVVLVRVNGQGSEVVVDRKEELTTFNLLRVAGLAPPVYCIFNNGMAYGYFPSVTLDVDTVRLPGVQSLIADVMARFHTIKTDMLKSPVKSPCSRFREKTQTFLDLIPERYTKPEMQEQCEALSLSKDKLRRELSEVIEHLESLDMETVFCHNDLWVKNIVYNKKNETIRFIDYEYAFYNYAAFDIGTHFIHYAGWDENIDFALYPDRDEQFRFLRLYLESRAKLEGKAECSVTQTDVDRLYVQANNCALASHLFWSIWVLVQAEFSPAEFDYMGNVQTRMDEYFRRKTEFLSLKMPEV